MKELKDVQASECLDYLFDLRPTVGYMEYQANKNFLYEKYKIPDLQIEFDFEERPLYVS